MARSKKKRVFIVLAVILLVAAGIAIPILYLNSEWYLSTVEHQFDYEIVGDSVTITDVNGIHYTIKNGHLNIPATLEGKPVTTIGEEAFKEIEELKTVSIPDSVTNIGSSAFKYCHNLITVTIPDSVIGIDAEAFLGCSSLTSVVFGSGITNIGPGVFQSTGLKKLVIPEGVTDIGKSAFQYCRNMVSVSIPSSVTNIDDSAFYECSGLISITIPASVTNIGENAFSSCKKLIEVQNLSNLAIKVGSQNHGSIGIYAKNIYTETTGASKLQTVDDYLFYVDGETVYLMSYTGGASTLTLPEGLNGQSYAIYQHAFYDCPTLTSVTVGEGVYAIGLEAFSGCNNLASMTLPFVGKTREGKEDTHFGYIFNGFSGPSSLKSVTIIGASKIAKEAFINCHYLKNITIGDSVETIGFKAFHGCDSLTSLTIPFVGSAKNLGKKDNSKLIYLFGGGTGISYTYPIIPSSLKSVTVTGGSSIGDSAFSEFSNLTTINLSDGVTTIGKSAFASCSGLTTVNIPDSVTNIGESAFSGCTALSSITISDYVESIGDSAFRGCTGLTSITIGEGVSSIGTYAFEGCEKLTTVYYKGTAETWSSISIKSNNSKLTSAKRYYVD